MNAPRRHWGRFAFAPLGAFLLVVFASQQLTAQNDCGYLPYEVPPYKDLTINGINARFYVSNVHFYTGVGSSYFETPAGSGRMGIFAANMLIAGETGGELRATVGDFRPNGVTPGPLDEAGNPSDECESYRRVYKVSQRDLLEFEATGTAIADLLDWPWQGGAPVFDGDGVEGNYDLEAGDRPAIEGHEMLWYVVNDAHDGPRKTDSLPMGLELQVSSFGASSDDPSLDYAVLVRYRLTNRGVGPLTSAYFGIHSVSDLGRDLVGSDTALGLAFGYSANGKGGVGSVDPHPGAIGYIVLEGLAADDDGIDNDGNGPVDEPGERTRMARFLTWSFMNSDPKTKEDYYGYFRGLWRNGQRITYGGNGLGFSDIPVDFMYPGEPGEFWSGENIYGDGISNVADYDFMWSTGPFSLDVGESKDLVVAIIWAQGEDRFDSVRKLKEAVPKLRTYWEDGFQIPLPDPPSVVPELYAPDNKATEQPTNLRLSWHKQPDHERHEVQISRTPEFTVLLDSAFTSSANMELSVADDATYYWRVRGVNAGGYGPWSKPWSFSTGSVEQVAPGPLEINAGGLQNWAFIQTEGAEGDNDACNPAAESRFGCEEVGGNVVYGSFNGAQTWIMYSNGLGPEYGIGRFAPRDFELRFTLKGSYGYHAETTGRVIHVPFEAWDIGPVGPFGTNEPSDDIQLIPGLYSDNKGECFFGFGELPEDFFGLGWPVTDRIHAYYPAEGTTYGDWATAVEPLVEASAAGCPSSPETDDAAELVNTDRRPLQNLIFMMDPTAENYRPEGIPIGNVIRFLTTKPTPPVPSAPADEATFYVVGSLDKLSLWWQLPPGILESRVEVTRTRDGSEVVVDSVVSGSTIELEDLLIGAYSWRVSYSTDAEFWSEPSRFAVLSFTSAENEFAGIPAVLTLREPYPNPTNGLTHFDVGLPQTGGVTLTAYDLLGRRVANVADEPMAAGWRTVDWNTTAVSNGVYVVRLQAGGAAVSRKVVVVK